MENTSGLWKLFEETGSVSLYLLYRQRFENDKENTGVKMSCEREARPASE